MENSRFKFRAWHKKDCIMLTVSEIRINKCGYIQHFKAFEYPIIGYELVCPGEDIYLMQFTSLLDKNLKEIYERDIVYISDYGRYEVKFSNGKFISDCLEIIGLESFMFDDDLLTNGNSENVEIIGNVFENPELLKNDQPMNEKCRWERFIQKHHSDKINIECWPDGGMYIQYSTELKLKYCPNCGKEIEEIEV
jgi:uncharacterized phage protein (TIGR01671 family)